jgi:hypothetical protein
MSDGAQKMHRMVSVATVAAITAVLLAVGAGAAQASPKLFLTTENGGLYTGQNKSIVIFKLPDGSQCYATWLGETSRNDAAKITNSVKEYVGIACERFLNPPSPDTISVSLSKLTLHWNGQVKLTGTADIVEPGPCIYEFRTMTAKLAPPVAGERHQLFASGPATGALVRKQSNIFCEPVQTPTWEFGSFGLTGEGTNLESELRG